MRLLRGAGQVRGAETLEAKGVDVHFEGLAALADVDLTLHKGEILGLIGPNGAGKTTLVNVLSGFQRPTKGTVTLDERVVTRLSADRRAVWGIARTFQSVRIFGGLTALENVESGAVAVGLGRLAARRLAWELLDFVDLAGVAHRRASELPHGHERRLGVLRALATRPSFLLLDEPAAGLDESESDELVVAIARIRDHFGCGVLVIEHDMRLIMGVCERIEVLDYGRVISVGTPDAVRHDESVIAAYLGNFGASSSAPS